MEVSRITVALIAGLLIAGCDNPHPDRPTQEWTDYWHAGKAEISSYDLVQSRYGEPRNGKAVLIFVTEDLSNSKQVKLDDPSRGNNINVLKLNFTKNFVTGIYPYSLMLSVFTPTDPRNHPSTIKATMSSQEWCGQVYTQLNLKGQRYAVRSHSYFEKEGDEHYSLKRTLLEDEIWNRIRIDHNSLPEGEIKLVPALFHSRLTHIPVAVHTAIASKRNEGRAIVYELVYPENSRKVAIRFEQLFPHRILGWTESWVEKGKTVETAATLDKTIFTDYWTKNKNEFLYLRDSLNLPHF